MACKVYYRINPTLDAMLRFFLCDTDADLPSSGMFPGEIAITIDHLKFYLADTPTSWIEKGPGISGFSKITVGSSEPSNPSIGDLWIDTS